MEKELGEQRDKVFRAQKQLERLNKLIRKKKGLGGNEETLIDKELRLNQAKFNNQTLLYHLSQFVQAFPSKYLDLSASVIDKMPYYHYTLILNSVIYFFLYHYYYY